MTEQKDRSSTVDKPRLLDLYCCEGGAAKGYADAGFDVYGVDLFKHKDAKGRTVGFSQARYPYPSRPRRSRDGSSASTG